MINVKDIKESLDTNKNGAVSEFVPVTFAFASKLTNPSPTNPNGNFLKRFSGGPLNPLDII